MSSHVGSPFWILNGLMLWGAVLGYIIGTSAVNIRDAARHRGPAIVRHGDDAERPEKVSESQYKRHKYTINGMMLALGLGLWVVVAKTAKKDAAKPNA